MATGARRAPIHRMAWAGIAMAALAGVLALYGSMHAEKHIADSPLRAARNTSGQTDAPPKPGNWHERLRTWVERNVLGRTTDDLDREVLALTERSKVANYSIQILAYLMPFALGLAGALTGGWAMKAVQASGGKYAGNTLAFFSMMIGGLAAVVAGCMMVSLYVWPHLPKLYTT